MFSTIEADSYTIIIIEVNPRGLLKQSVMISSVQYTYYWRLISSVQYYWSGLVHYYHCWSERGGLLKQSVMISSVQYTYYWSERLVEEGSRVAFSAQVQLLLYLNSGVMTFEVDGLLNRSEMGYLLKQSVMISSIQYTYYWRGWSRLVSSVQYASTLVIEVNGG